MVTVRALTVEGLTMAAIGLIGRDLRFCCAVPRPFARRAVASVVVTLSSGFFDGGLCGVIPASRSYRCSASKSAVSISILLAMEPL